MNFERLPPVENSKLLLDLAFRKARRKGMQKNLKGNWLQIIRQKECLKLDIIKDTLVPRLETILTSFPSLDHLPPFYIKLMKLTIDYSTLKTSLGAINWAIKRVRSFQKQYVSKIIKEKEQSKIKDLSNEFYGRVSSTLKQIDPNLVFLEESRKIMKSYPDIKEMFTVCLYGFPNVGKTTLLNNLTNTTAKVAAYSFTTKNINIGYFIKDHLKIQVIDVPGTLARTDKLNNIELQAELVREDLADVIIYVFDVSEFCGYSLKKQEELLKNIGKKKKVLIYLSKTDLPEGKPTPSFEREYYSLSELEKEIQELAIEHEKKVKELAMENNTED